MGATCIGIEIVRGGIGVKGTGIKDWCVSVMIIGVDDRCGGYRYRSG